MPPELNEPMPSDAASTPSDPVQPPASAASDPPVHNRRRIAANIFGLTGIYMVMRVAMLVGNIYTRRVLGPAMIGIISWNAALLTYLFMLTNPGMQTIAKRDVAKDPSRSTELTSLRLTAQILLTIPAFLIALVIAFSGLREHHASTLLIIQALSLFVISINWIPEAHEKVLFPTAVTMVMYVVQLPLMLWLVKSPDDAAVFAFLAIPLNLAVIPAIAWYSARKGMLRIRDLRPSLKGFWAMNRESWPLTVSTAASTIYYNSDTIILGFTADDVTVGYYSTAYLTMLVPFVFHVILWNAYLPSLSRASEDSDARLAVSSEFMKMCAWIGFPIAAMGWAVGRHVMTLLMGPAYEPCGPYFEWLCLDLALIFYNHGAASPLMLWGRQTTHLRMTVWAAIVNLALNLVLIPAFGAWGAVVTTLAAEVVVLIWATLIRRSLAPLPIRSVLHALVWFAIVGGVAKGIVSVRPGWWWGVTALGAVMTGLYWWHVLGRRFLSKLPWARPIPPPE